VHNFDSYSLFLGINNILENPKIISATTDFVLRTIVLAAEFMSNLHSQEWLHFQQHKYIVYVKNRIPIEITNLRQPGFSKPTLIHISSPHVPSHESNISSSPHRLNSYQQQQSYPDSQHPFAFHDSPPAQQSLHQQLLPQLLGLQLEPPLPPKH